MIRSTAESAVVIGGSAGALAPLRGIVAALPADFAGALLIVLHTAQDSPGVLPRILGSSARIEVEQAIEGATIEEGRVYVAQPDRHLLVVEGRLKVSRGPRENRSRPAIDPLFRTAAEWFGPKLVGVLLSGMLSDGTYGLAVIKARGGVTVTQDPDDAAYPDMPRTATVRVGVDHVLRPLQIARLLIDTTRASREGRQILRDQQSPA